MFYSLQVVRIRRKRVFLLEFYFYISVPLHFEIAHGLGPAEVPLIKTFAILVKTANVESQGQPAGCL